MSLCCYLSSSCKSPISDSVSCVCLQGSFHFTTAKIQQYVYETVTRIFRRHGETRSRRFMYSGSGFGSDTSCSSALPADAGAGVMICIKSGMLEDLKAIKRPVLALKWPLDHSKITVTYGLLCFTALLKILISPYNLKRTVENLIRRAEVCIWYKDSDMCLL